MNEIDFDSITFTDNFMFQSVMMDEGICKEVLERIMQIKLSKITIPQQEKAVQGGLLSRSVRFDVYCEDEEGNAFDVEMQNVNRSDLPMRARYYQSMIDSSMLEKGIKDYRQLRRGVIIFLCDFNPFDGEHRLYHGKIHLVESPNYPYEDRSLKIFACTEGKSDDTPVEILRFLSYLKDKKSNDGLTDRIEEKVEGYRKSSSWRGEYMTNHAYEWDLLERGREQGRTEGLALGKAEGIAQGRTEGIAQGKTDTVEMFGKLADALKADGKEGMLYEAAKDAGLFEELCRRYGIA